MQHVLLSLYRSLSWDLYDGVRECREELATLKVHVSNDIRTVARRLQSEGPEFLTLTTPLFSKHILACLEAGSYTPFYGLRVKKGSILPCYLHGWLVRIFDSTTGYVLDFVDPQALKAVRQLTVLASKAKVLPKLSVCRKTFQKYERMDHEIDQESLWSTSISTFGYTPSTVDQHFTVDLRWGSIDGLGRLFLASARAVGAELDRWYCYSYPTRGTSRPMGQLRPKHGPGAVSERLDADGKWRTIVRHPHCNLGNHFPHYWLTSLEGIDLEHRGGLCQDHPPSRLIAVPKTSQVPRLIAAEPVANQFWQQALNRVMNEAFDRSWLSRSINLHDQERSQRLARLGSQDQTYGTIDLSAASDSVTLDHVGALFQHDSQLLDGILSSRTERMHIPGSGVIRLRKFASMGSAVCFPVETAVFLAAVAASIMRQLDQPFSNDRLRSICRDITVYGDDIIAPTQYIPGILRDLHRLGFTANTSKSFFKSKFREACGGDYYDGVSVKPIYLRVDFWSRKRLQDSDVVSLTKTSRLMFDAGLWRSAELLVNLVEEAKRTTLPYANQDPGYLAHNIPWREEKVKSRFNRYLHTREIKALAVKPRVLDSNLDGYARLCRFLVTQDNNLSEPDFLYPADQDWTTIPTRGFLLEPTWCEAVA